ncbi:hypothetical protein Tco_1370956 [Tanacetum coccineum]
MSPLDLQMNFIDLAASSIEIEGIIKIQPIAGVDDTILCSLGWSNLEFLNNRRVGTYHFARGAEGSRTQMYYEFGIFSTIYGGKVMPTWIRRRRKGPSISFTIPSSPNKLRGLNLSYVQTLIRPYWRPKEQYENSEYPFHQLIDLPHIKIRNMTKNLTWLYMHHLDRVNVGGKSLTFLSHWMFGENEMEVNETQIKNDSLKHSLRRTPTHVAAQSRMYQNRSDYNLAMEGLITHHHFKVVQLLLVFHLALLWSGDNLI